VRQQIPSQRDLPFHCDGKGSHGKSPIFNPYRSNGIVPYIQGSSETDFAFTCLVRVAHSNRRKSADAEPPSMLPHTQA
jgi:hypothetical protein